MKTQLRGTQVLNKDITSEDIGTLTGSLDFSSGSIYMGSGAAGPLIISASHGAVITGSLSVSGETFEMSADTFELSGDRFEMTGSLVVTGSVDVTGSVRLTGALVTNNISGSSANSSKIGITGSVVFANVTDAQFPSSIPVASSFFYVSGSRSSVGAEQPGILFAGDVFVSGGIGTNDYLQLKPVGALKIPTNVSASYVYVSGSTNDIYFTQYAPGTSFTNTTRLRWLESTLTTGLLHGGVLSTANGSTTFSLTSGSGIVVSQNATTTSDPYPTIKFVQWPAFVSQSITNVATAQLTYIGIDSNGSIVQRVTPFTDGEFNSYISIGRVLHQAGGVTNGTSTTPTVSYGVNSWVADFNRSFGPLKVSGHILAASGTSPTLSIKKTDGTSYVVGRNYTFDPNNPNTCLPATDSVPTVSKIYREHVSGSTPVVDTGIAFAGYAGIDPTQRLNTTTGLLTSVGVNKITIQRVYWFPNSVNKAFYVYYGSTDYDTLAAAESGIVTETFTEGSNTADAAILLGYILVKNVPGGADLNNATEAKFIQAGLFRGIASTAGGGGGGTTTPGGSDTYVQFNDGGGFGGDSGLTYDKTTDVLTIGNVSIGDTGVLRTSDKLVVSGGLGVEITGAIRTASEGVFIGVNNLAVAGSDAFLYVSGSKGPAGTGNKKAVFGGDVYISGSMQTINGVYISDNNSRFTLEPDGAGEALYSFGPQFKLASYQDTLFDLGLGATNPTFRTLLTGDGTAEGFFQWASGTYPGVPLMTLENQTGKFALGPNLASTVGADVQFYVSGAIDSDKKAVFGGDVVTSGSTFLAGQIIYASGTVAGVGASARTNESGWLYPFNIVPSTVGVVSDAVVIAGTQPMAGVVIGEGSLTGFPPTTTGANMSLSEGNNSLQFTSGSFYGFIVSSNDGAGTPSNPLFEVTYADPDGRKAVVVGEGIGNVAFGSDAFLYVSGSLDGSDKAVFGGHTVVSGSRILNVVSGTAAPSYTVNVGDHVVVFTANNVTATLPPSAPVGTRIIFKDGTGQAATLGGQRLECGGLIDDANFFTLDSVNYTGITVIKINGSPETWVLI